MSDDTRFLRKAIALARASVAQGGRPFGAVVVRDGDIVASAVNEMHLVDDPTAHAELLAVRRAAEKLGSADLAGCIVYASGQPCPMCMAAMRMAGVSQIRYAYSNADGAPYGLSTAAVHADLARPFASQSMTIRHQRVDTAEQPQLYADWYAGSGQGPR